MSSYYDTVILADSPVSYWPLADPTGTTAADSGDSNPGTYQGGVTLGGAAPFPGMSGSTAFNGSTGYASVPDASNLHLVAPLSIEAWFKTTYSGANYQIICAKYAPTTFHGFGLSVVGTTQTLGMLVGDGWHAIGPGVNDGYWHHVVAVLSGTTITMYVDGTSRGTASATPSLSNTTALKIGTDPSSAGASSFLGSLGAPGVYNYALSSTQVANHYWASVGSLSLGTRAKPTAPALQSAWASNLLAAYNLGEGSSTAADLSGNAHTGTLTGGCTWSSGAYGTDLALADNGTTGSYLSLGSFTALSGVAEFTFSCLCQLDTYTDAPRGNLTRFLIGTQRSGTTLSQASLFFSSTPRTIQFNARYNDFPSLVAPAPPLNQWILITGRVTAAGEQSIWYNGVKVASQSLVSYAYASDITPVGSLGDTYSFQTGNNWSGPVAMGLYATRGYLDAEIVALAADPFVWGRVKSGGGAALMMGM
jgi:trimeric autotransporter adhesin